VDVINLTNLIENIVREVLTEKGLIPSKNYLLESPSPENIKSPSSDISSIVSPSINKSLCESKKIISLTLFTGSNLNADVLFEQLRNLSQRVQLHCIISKGFLNYFKIEYIQSELPNAKIFLSLGEDEISREIECSDVLLIPFLSRNTATKVALSITDSLATNVFFQSIVKGKKIVAVRSGADPDAEECPVLSNLPKQLKNILREYITILKSAGVIFVEPTKFYSVAERIIFSTFRSRSEKSEPRYFTTGKAVITVDDLKDFLKISDDKVFSTPTNSIITPSAIDFAKENEIKLIFKD